MKFLILGDTHCEWEPTNVTVAQALSFHPDITHIIQVGDFGYGWPQVKPLKFSKAFFDNEDYKLLDNIEKLWIDGNHENFDKLDQDNGAWQPGWKYVSRGSVLSVNEVNIMFMGGASSIDKMYRVPHQSWWPQETIKYSDINKALQYDGKIHAIISHEHPSSFPYSDERYGDSQFHEGKSDQGLLNVLLEKYKPDYWFFGHHHAFQEGLFDNTHWLCAPIINSRKAIIWEPPQIPYLFKK